MSCPDISTWLILWSIGQTIRPVSALQATARKLYFIQPIAHWSTLPFFCLSSSWSWWSNLEFLWEWRVWREEWTTIECRKWPSFFCFPNHFSNLLLFTFNLHFEGTHAAFLLKHIWTFVLKTIIINCNFEISNNSRALIQQDQVIYSDENANRRFSIMIWHRGRKLAIRV